MKRMKGRGKGERAGKEWLLIKKKDEASQAGWDIEQHAVSVKTGRTQAEIAADLPAKKKAAPRKKKVTTRILRRSPEQYAPTCRVSSRRWPLRLRIPCRAVTSGCSKSNGTAFAGWRSLKTAR